IERSHMNDQSPVGNRPTLALLDLTKMTGHQLGALYELFPPGEIPDGDSHGKAIILPGTWLGGLLSAIANFVWGGKVFDRARLRLVNKIFGLHLVHAKVSKGTSWSDGRDAVIIDYWKTSLVAFFIRDEIRQVEPGLYLGRAYIRLPFGKHFSALFFALDFRNNLS
ncbi:MAG TPA: hypothetical protein V6C69_14750, partial [Trichormus sp.]